MLPENYFPGADPVRFATPLTKEVQYFNLNTHTPLIDEKVHAIVSNENNKIHVLPNIKKILHVDAELLTTEKQKEDCKYHAISKKSLITIRTINVSDLLNADITFDEAFVKVRAKLHELLAFGLCDLFDLVYIPEEKYKYGNYGNNSKDWYNTMQFKPKTHFCNNAALTPENVIALDYRSIVHFSNNRPLAQEELHKIRRLLENEDTRTLALEVMNVLNPEHSYMELMLAFNSIPNVMKKKNKAQILPLMQEIYNLDVTREPYGLEQICMLNKKYFGEPTQQQLEFVADNYHSVYNEPSSLFEFKLKIKK